MGQWRVEVSSPGELDVSSFEIEGKKAVSKPNFFGKGTSANAAVVRVFDSEGKILTTSILSISGVSGEPVIRSISNSSPARERKAEKDKPKP